jgi:hypothetical protein
MACTNNNDNDSHNGTKQRPTKDNEKEGTPQMQEVATAIVICTVCRRGAKTQEEEEEIESPCILPRPTPGAL